MQASQRAAVEGAQAAVAVAEHVLDLREEAGIREAAVEEGELVTCLEPCLDESAPDELRAAEDEDPHSSPVTPASRRSTSSSVL